MLVHGEPPAVPQVALVRHHRGRQDHVTWGALVLIAGLVGAAASFGGSWRTPALALVGVSIGFTLFKSQFGFADSFRAALTAGDFTGFRAQALALIACTVVMFPLLALSGIYGWGWYGFGAPIGITFAIGAVLFGIGMQIGGGCASGTLFALGGGNGRLLVTLATFILGSVLGAADLDRWTGLPQLPPFKVQELLGWPAAYVAQIGVLLLCALRLPTMRPGTSSVPWPAVRKLASKPWPLALGAVLLAALNGLTLVVAGHPWGETSGFTLWGSKFALALGWDAGSWPYWRAAHDTLMASIFADDTSVMDFGIIFGAALAASLGKAFHLRFPRSARDLAGPVLGGLLMGYGARLSGGCNIGAYFSAIASGALSGWAWVAFAFAGSAIGLRIRRVLSAS